LGEFTGERVIPGQVETDLWNEHFSRYAFATLFASGKRVLDLGCGSGYGSAELARTAESVIGVDVSAAC
jgi:methylase of polypeptide subunit release factors